MQQLAICQGQYCNQSLGQNLKSHLQIQKEPSEGLVTVWSKYHVALTSYCCPLWTRIHHKTINLGAHNDLGSYVTARNRHYRAAASPAHNDCHPLRRWPPNTNHHTWWYDQMDEHTTINLEVCNNLKIVCHYWNYSTLLPSLTRTHVRINPFCQSTGKTQDTQILILGHVTISGLYTTTRGRHCGDWVAASPAQNAHHLARGHTTINLWACNNLRII